MFTYETYVRKSGAIGYRVREGEALRIEQSFAPGLSGFVAMTEAEATAYALADIAQLELPPVEAEPAAAE